MSLPGVVLVTGGAGYVGSTLVGLLLRSGYRVRVLDCLRSGGECLLSFWYEPRFEFVAGDIRDRPAVRQAMSAVEAVVHLAAIVGDPACARQPEDAESVNLSGSHVVLEESLAARVSRFVFASTCSNYGRMARPDQLVDETSELRPLSLYARTKVEFERFLLSSSSDAGPSTTCLRFATVFGVAPRMRFDLTVNQFTAEALLRRRLVVFGAQFWRPYVHVFDAARGIQHVLEAPRAVVRGQAFNVGATELNYRKKEVATEVASAIPGTEVEFVPQQDDPRDYRVSFARIESTLGFRVTRSLQEGIHEVSRLIRDQVITDPLSPRYCN